MHIKIWFKDISNITLAVMEALCKTFLKVFYFYISVKFNLYKSLSFGTIEESCNKKFAENAIIDTFLKSNINIHY